MQYYRRSIRQARLTRTKAFFITLLFHLLLIGYFTSGSDLSLLQYLPESMQELLGSPSVPAATQEGPRP